VTKFTFAHPFKLLARRTMTFHLSVVGLKGASASSAQTVTAISLSTGPPVTGLPAHLGTLAPKQ
jgi:hypothetical protein